MKRLTAYIGFFLLTITGCAPEHYLCNDFEIITVDHKLIAILPFEMIFTGMRPKDVSIAEWEKLEVNESVIFQRSFFKEILQSLQNGRKPMWVKVQNYRTTLEILEENNIGIKETWYVNGEYLADVLGVDAVIRARIQKNRIMPEIAANSIGLALDILDFYLLFRDDYYYPSGSVYSSVVHADYALINKDDGEILWAIDYDIGVDWTSTPNSIIDKINRKSAKVFPYRIK